ncbi:hypothetical protein STCU_00416 [Strigomonas culicis]|nr:hypothetical protein STCU_00416 [Strigomonas culicis]|eukprot:EPY36769.1 hypothetical protein STCU_00416 [Strigomonas culicis]
MKKRNLEKEKQLELAAIWGAEVDGDARFPKRRGSAKKPQIAKLDDEELPLDTDVLSDFGSDVSGELEKAEKPAAKRAKTAKKPTFYRLHCFVEPGTEKNAVRTVFEDYEPKVELRSTQKGNALNKAQYAVLTFSNKAMALHAVKMLDGTNQRDLLGTKCLKLSLMLNRQQSKIARRRENRVRRQAKKKSAEDEHREDMEFLQKFIHSHAQR